MDNEKDNQHFMTTRSKRKRKTGNLVFLGEEFLQKEEDIESDNELVLKIQENQKRRRLPSDLQDFIVEDTDSDFEEDYDDEEDEEEEEDDLAKSERELTQALAGYINKNLEIIEKEEECENNEIFTQYDNKMKKHFLSLEEVEQDNILKLEEEIKTLNNEIVPLRYQLLKCPMDIKVKAVAIKKLNSLESMDSSGNEYYKLKSYVEGLMQIPFGKYQHLPITKLNSPSEITDYMLKCSGILDSAVYSHPKAKSQILQIVGKWISNPQSKGSVFSIMGPMGNGKTTLVKEGIAKMINRPFEFISLGGATDSSLLDGHSYTYEGAIPGRIVEILKKSRCMNPVIYFDELDKVSNTPKGEEIINLLIHLTDFSQNDRFMDKYYSDIPLDLSQALFIFSLNNMENVNPILRDRMMMIQTGKLLLEDKIKVSQDYIIPKILLDIGIKKEDIIFSEEVIQFCITNYSKEDGVRNLKRTYETLLEKLNILRLLQVQEDKEMGKKLNFSSQMTELLNKKVSFPLNITVELIRNLVEEPHTTKPPYMMYS